MSAGFNDPADRLLITSNIPAWNASLTQMAYFKPTSTGSLQTLFTRLIDDLTRYSWCGLLSDLTPYFENSDANNRSMFSTLTAGTWYDIAVTIDASTFIMYVDTVETINWTWGYNPAEAPTRMEMGGWRSANGNAFVGDLSAIRYWNRVLTQPQVAAEHGFAQPQDAANIYGWWPLNTSDFGTDRSGNGNHWTIGGALSLTADPPGVTFPSSGISIPVAMHHLQQQGMS